MLFRSGGLRLDGSAVTVFSEMQLSDALSAQVASGRGRQLPAGTQLSVPVTIRGTTDRYQIEVDTAGTAPVRTAP